MFQYVIIFIYSILEAYVTQMEVSKGHVFDEGELTPKQIIIYKAVGYIIK